MNADKTTTFHEVKKKVLNFARERDWEQFHAPKNLSMAIAAEAAELMEHFLWHESSSSRDIVFLEKKRTAIKDELADIIIYALEFANSADIDVSTAIEEKLKKNAEKYPIEKARGISAKYTEI